MQEPLFLKPVFQEKIWGGDKLHTVFGYDLPSDKIGECWAISAHPHGVSIVENGPYKGEKLDALWQNQKQLFGNSKGEVFPLLTKILDAEDDLSVQVHPDDTYGLAHEGELGKTECWYVIDADPGAEIIYGHHAKTKAELREMIEAGKWDALFEKVKVKAGDFFYVPSGTIHGIGKGIMILETQQSSDTTYRLFDYNRKDDDGKLRPLHIEDSIAVTTVPFTPPILNIREKTQGNSSVTTFVENEFFTVAHWKVDGILSLRSQGAYTLVSVIKGAGKLYVEDVYTSREDCYELAAGVHFILPNEIKKWRIEGLLEMIASVPGNKV